MQHYLNTEEINAIKRALDSVRDEYTENNKIIFANESERAKSYFGTVKRGLQRWAKSKHCMVPGCSSQSIARSHTIPKGMSLSIISENDHLLTPVIDHKIGAIKLKMTGLSNATTFPGFCSKHELLFEDYENKKSIDTEAHVYLQVYRAACRELFRVKFLIEQYEWAMREYSKERNEGLLRLVRERAQTNGLQKHINFKSFAFEDDPLLTAANDRLDPVRKLEAHLEKLLLPAIEKAVFQNDESGLSITAIKLDLEIPVALAGSAPFFVNENDTKKEVVLLMNVVPYAGNTLIILGALSSQDRYVKEYKTYWMKHALSVLSMIESWMINGTDQWSLRPSVWYALSSDRQSKLLLQLFSCEKNISNECEVSIFDDIRKTLIEMSDHANSGNFTDEYVEYVKSERKKMI